MARDSMGHTLLVATVLCAVCSLLVSSAAVGLRDRQEQNKVLDRQKNVLIAAGIYDDDKNTLKDVPKLFESIERVLIDVETGQPVDSDVVDPETYDQRAAAKDPELSKKIAPEDDIAGIHRREKYAFVYEVTQGDQIEQVVLPIYGKGLWSTLYGFIAMDTDGTTVRGITFYEHAETPGLGGEVDNNSWKALWKGKKVFDDSGQMEIEVVKGPAPTDGPKADYQIDGLSGATITSRGVSNLVRYWLGPDGFGPFLESLRETGGSRG